MSLQTLHPDARLWVYQANEPFADSDLSEVNQHLAAFAQQWVSHNRQLSASSGVLYDRFVVLAVDETQAGASGCSIDSSVHFLKKLGANYQRDLFDRMRFSYEKDGQVHTVSRETFSQLYQNGTINDDTIVFDTLIKTVGELEDGFRKRLADSWHARMI